MWFDADAESRATTIRIKIETDVAESTPYTRRCRRWSATASTSSGPCSRQCEGSVPKQLLRSW
jgi:hypothetical protein